MCLWGHATAQPDHHQRHLLRGPDRFMTHILITLAAQTLVGLLYGRWFLGGLVFSAFYLGRELTQAEYRWISALGQGRRANMPWWGGFDFHVWNMKSATDALGPVLASLMLVAAVGLIKSVCRSQPAP